MDIDSTRWLKLRSGSEIRGPESLLTDEAAEKIGYAFACWLAERRGRTPDMLKLAVGRDERPSGARIKAALTRGMTAADSDVLDCGVCAAPALFMTTESGQEAADGAVMVTAGTAKPGLNGLKFITAGGGLHSADMADILRRAAGAEVPERLVVKLDVRARHTAALRAAAARWLEDDALKPLLGMKVIVDARSGLGAGYARFLEELYTPSERVELSKRWALMRELLAGKSQRAIARELRLSLCKITRGAKYARDPDSLFRRAVLAARRTP